MQIESERRKLAARFKRISGIAGGIVAILSLAVVVGWYFDIELFKHPFGTSVAFGVAFAYLMFGTVIALDAFVPEMKVLRIAKLVVVSLLTVMAAAKCVEGVVGTDWDALNINLSFNSERMVPLLYPGIMTPDTAIVQAILGCSYLMMDLWKNARVQIWQWLGVAVVVICLVPVFGFLLGDTNLCSLWGCVRMPVAFAITSIGLAFAILAQRPDRGFASALIEPDLLGTALRQSLIAALILLPLFAEAKSVLVHLGIFDEGLCLSSWALFCRNLSLPIRASRRCGALPNSGCKTFLRSFHRPRLTAHLVFQASHGEWPNVFPAAKNSKRTQKFVRKTARSCKSTMP